MLMMTVLFKNIFVLYCVVFKNFLNLSLLRKLPDFAEGSLFFLLVYFLHVGILILKIFCHMPISE